MFPYNFTNILILFITPSSLQLSLLSHLSIFPFPFHSTYILLSASLTLQLMFKTHIKIYEDKFLFRLTMKDFEKQVWPWSGSLEKGK